MCFIHFLFTAFTLLNVTEGMEKCVLDNDAAYEIQTIGLYEDANILWVIGDPDHDENREIMIQICNYANVKNGFCFKEGAQTTDYSGDLDDLKAGFRYEILLAFTTMNADEELAQSLGQRKEYSKKQIQNLLFSMSHQMKPSMKEYKTMINEIQKCKTYDVLVAYADKVVNGDIDLDFEKIYSHYFENDQYSKIMKDLLQSDPLTCFKMLLKQEEGMKDCLKLEDGVKEKVKIISQEAREIEMVKRVLERINAYPKIPTVVITGLDHLENLVNRLSEGSGKEIRTHVIYPSSQKPIKDHKRKRKSKE